MLSSRLRATPACSQLAVVEHGAMAMATANDVASRGPSHVPADEREGMLARLGLRFTNWAEHWFPDAYVFVCLALAVVAVAALINGATPVAIAASFGDGFWSLIVFTMQMVMVV